jgi:hypothetical protein
MHSLRAINKTIIGAAAAMLLALAAQNANAQVGELIDDALDAFANDDNEADAARTAEADAAFEAIMMPQNEGFINARKRAPAAKQLSQALEALGAAGADAAMSPYPSAPPPPPRPLGWTAPASGSTAEIPLDEFSEVRDALEQIRDQAELLEGPTVALGSSEYTGEAIPGALKLHQKLQVTLGKPDEWKTVPLVGDDVVLVGATVNRRPIPISRLNGYHVWVTKSHGEATVELTLLVPSRGPKGSLEYDFLVARTPVTRFSCRFPVADLEPRLDQAVQSEVTSEDGTSLLSATLRPTTRIHLVGFKDLGEADGQRAKVYAESLNLLSVDEGSLDLFTVVSYTILYAGAKQFDILVPEGMTVVSADGEGAFRFTLEKREDGPGTVIKGETAFPIRNKFEVSLRLKRQLGKGGEAFDVPLPRCLGVERQNGWLAVEVPGKLKLEEKAQTDVVAVDVRQLPEEMVRSAVSPIIRAYRYHSETAGVRLTATRLPEKEPESGSIDRIRAHSVVSPEGKVLTDMRITLRNRLQPTLAVQVQDDVSVRSVHLDGEAIRPSRDDDGALMLPLKRSEGGDRLEPFTLQVVMESDQAALGLFGSSSLVLPAVGLPVSTVSWTVYLPANNVYSTLEGDVEPQIFVYEATWHQPVYAEGPVRVARPGYDETGVELTEDGPSQAGSGLLGVRIELPRTGTRLDYSRYWVDRGRPLEVSFQYLRGWLRIPGGILLVLLLAAGCVLALGKRRTGPSTRSNKWAGVLVIAFSLWPLYKVADETGIVLGVIIGLIAVAARRGFLRSAPSAVADWARTLIGRFRERERDDKPLGAGTIVKLTLVGVGLFVFGISLLVATTEFAALLFNPL